METISTKDFIRSLYQDVSMELLKELKSLGIIEEYDIHNLEEPILRKDAARIIHMHMRIKLGIEDLPDISKAEVLRDLYDCRICVNHIAQVYLRGVMKPLPKENNNSGFLIFGGYFPYHKDDSSLNSLYYK